jgi:hypothetical protein
MVAGRIFLFAGLNGDCQAILTRRQGTGRKTRESAGRVVRFVEIYDGLSIR